MIQDEIKHPDGAQLAAFGLGKLDPEQAAEIESHVSECDACCEALGSIENDTFVDLVCTADTVEESPAPDADGLRSSEPNWRDQATLPPAESHESAAQEEHPIADKTADERESGAKQRMAAGNDSPSGDLHLPTDLADHSRYKVLELLGSGGMGSVYKAEHRLMERIVALKVINSRLTSNEAAIERFRREVKAAASLSHPNIVAAYDAEQAGSLQLLVMEFVDGTDLGAIIRKRKQLPVAEACDYLRQAALGLQHAFEYGMVHRDIKPQNLMLTPARQVKILDFGLAQLAGEAAGGGLTKEGSMMGTPDYMAPEQARDARSADIRADIYSLGCTLYALLTGQPPFPEGSEISKVMAHTEREPKPVSDFRSDVPAELIAVLRKMTAKDPRARYQTPAAVAAALEPFVSASAQPVVASKRPESHWKVGAVLALTLLLVTGVIFVVNNQGQLKINSIDDDVEVTLGGRGDRTVVQVNSAPQRGAANSLPAAEPELSEKEQSGLNAALSWLEIVDDGKYAESRNAAAELLQSQLTADKWASMLRPVRKPLGRLIYRELDQARFTTQLPNAPMGEFVVLKFKTDFERGRGADEEVVTIREGKNRWRVALYKVLRQPGAEPALSAKEQAAVRACLTWLKHLDAQRYAASRNAASRIFRSTVTAEAWTNAMKSIREQTGKLVDRKLWRAQDTSALQGLPEGNLVLLQFNSNFEKGKEARESITMTLERGNRWRVASYAVTPRTVAPPPKSVDEKTIRTFKSSETPISQDGMTRDEEGWKFVAAEPKTVRLFEVNDLDVENSQLVYRAKIKTENLDGKAYLEMWVRTPGLGESFSKGLNQTVSGTTGWATYETPFFLQKGQKTNLVKLNLVIEGEGSVWIKQVELLSTPLPSTQPSP